MAVTAVGSPQSSGLTQRQRWGLYLTLGFGLLGFTIGISLRDSALTATTSFSNAEVGLEARYPESWLIDTAGNYVFRVRDISRVGFKTTMEVAILPVNPGVTSERNVLDALTLNRSQTLADYNVQSVRQYLLPDESQALRMDYTFVAVETEPFLEAIPVVIQGVDVIVSRRVQAIVITFLADRTTFEQDFPVFERFLGDLRF